MNIVYKNTDLENLFTRGVVMGTKGIKGRKELLQTLFGVRSIFQAANDVSELQCYHFLNYANRIRYSTITLDLTSVKCEIKFYEGNDTIILYEYTIKYQTQL